MLFSTGDLKCHFKFRVDLICCFENIALSIFLTFGLKLPNHAHLFVVLGGLDTLNNFFVNEMLKRHILGWICIVWRIHLKIRLPCDPDWPIDQQTEWLAKNKVTYGIVVRWEWRNALCRVVCHQIQKHFNVCSRTEQLRRLGGVTQVSHRDHRW